MHLSLLSDTAYETYAAPIGSRPATGRAHRDGLLRGLAFLAAIAVPLTLAVATGRQPIHDAAAGYAQAFDARP